MINIQCRRVPNLSLNKFRISSILVRHDYTTYMICMKYMNNTTYFNHNVSEHNQS